MRQHNEIVTAPRTGAQHPHKDNSFPSLSFFCLADYEWFVRPEQEKRRERKLSLSFPGPQSRKRLTPCACELCDTGKVTASGESRFAVRRRIRYL